jgi:hypothetical protein
MVFNRSAQLIRRGNGRNDDDAASRGPYVAGVGQAANRCLEGVKVWDSEQACLA